MHRPVDVLISQSPLKALKQDLLVHQLCDEIAVKRLEQGEIAEYLANLFPDSGVPSDLAAWCTVTPAETRCL